MFKNRILNKKNKKQAILKSGDIINTVKQIVMEKLTQAKGSHDWDHTQRVYKMALHLAKEERADYLVVSLAALFHDIGRPVETQSLGQVCHAQVGASLARSILNDYNIDHHLINRIIHCIETHRFRNNKMPETLEAKIIFDADKLDAIGAVGIGRAFLFAGEVGARLHNKDIDIEQTKAYTTEDTAYREYYKKLRFIKDRILTLEGKRIAEKRHSFMVDFFQRIDLEVDGML